MTQHRHGGIAWDWTPAVWAWSPAEGRWSPSYGVPQRCVRLDVSTDGVEPAETYEYWRETVFYYFAADRQPRVANPRSDDANAFHARANVLVSARGEFRRYHSDAVSGSRTRRQVSADGGDSVDLGLVIDGVRLHREGEIESVAGPGEFFVYDASKPSHVRWTAHRGVHLTLRREEVVAELGRDVPPADEMTKALQASRHSRYFRRQLEELARRLDALTMAEREFLLDHAINSALALLRQALGIDKQSERCRDYLYDAAVKLIERRLDDPSLDATLIADLLGCSRATLYRAFADHSSGVYGYIRELRLQRAKALLEAPPPGANVAAIAESVGFTNLSNFGRSFRQRFGQSPGQWMRDGRGPQ